MEHDIFQRIEKSEKPDFAEILSKSFDLFMKIWQVALKHGLIMMVVVVPFILLIYIPFLPMYLDIVTHGELGGGGPFEGQSVGFWIGYSVIVLLLSFLMQTVTISVTAHFYRFLRKEEHGSTVEVGGYFDDFKENFGKIFTLSLATFGITIAAALLCYLPIFYVMVPLQLILPIYAYNKKLSVSDIVKAAFKLGNKYWLIIFGLVWIAQAVAQIGIIFCFIGIFATALFVHVPVYYVYKDSLGFDDDPDQISA